MKNIKQFEIPSSIQEIINSKLSRLNLCLEEQQALKTISLFPRAISFDLLKNLSGIMSKTKLTKAGDIPSKVYMLISGIFRASF